jgi:hypothetical protein
MKNIAVWFLAIFFVFLATAAGQADPLSLTEGCVDVSISVRPDCVQAGDTITVSGSIRNCSRREVVVATFEGFGIAEIIDTDGKAQRHFKPKLVASPGRRRNTREFNFQAKVPDDAVGTYLMTLHAEGKKSGMHVEDTARLTVGDCGIMAY